MSFDPSKAYNEDWRYLDFIESVTWERPENGGVVTVPGFKAKWGSFETADFRSFAAGMALNGDESAVALWEPKPDDVDLADWVPRFQPRNDHVLRRESHGNQGWLIRGYTHSRFGYWVLAVVEEPTNG